jgi:hypothetical protein
MDVHRLDSWVVCRSSLGGPLAVSVPDLGEALAVFSFEEEADLYLLLNGTVGNVARDDPWAWSVSSHALLALLRTQWSHFEWVVLDPMPERDARFMLRLASVRRDDFVDSLSGHVAMAEEVAAGSGKQPVSG